MAADELIYRVSYHLVAGAHDAAGLLAELGELWPRELVRFDQRSRSELPWGSVDRMSPGRLRDVLQLCSPSGHVRQAALERSALTVLTVRLIVLRSADWVPEVRDAALARLEGCPSALLIDALPLAEQLARERRRGGRLERLFDARLEDDDLRAASRAGDTHTRRVATQRLGARGAITADGLHAAASDEDVVIRGVAAHALADAPLPDDERHALADVLVRDRVGWIAAQALALLVELEGADAIVRALAARSATVRRAARDWARVRDVDARRVYLTRVPPDDLKLIGLAEIGDARDVPRFRTMLVGSRQVRSAGLRALARHDRPTARGYALAALRFGPANRAAADILRDGAPNTHEISVLTEIACDSVRPERERLRALSLLRPAPWTHFTVALESNLEPDDLLMPQGRPDERLRTRLARQVDRLPYPRSDALAFVLRT